MDKPNGTNGNSTMKGAQKCRTPHCTCTANPDSGYCFACEIAWEQFGREVANWYALKDAAEAAGWARR